MCSGKPSSLFKSRMDTGDLLRQHKKKLRYEKGVALFNLRRQTTVASCIFFFARMGWTGLQDWVY